MSCLIRKEREGRVNSKGRQGLEVQEQWEAIEWVLRLVWGEREVRFVLKRFFKLLSRKQIEILLNNPVYQKRNGSFAEYWQ